MTSPLDNLCGREGDLNVTERLVADLIATGGKLVEALDLLGPR